MTPLDITKVNEKFHKRYAKLQQDLNKFITPVIEQNGEISIPDVVMSGTTELEANIVTSKAKAFTPELKIKVNAQDIEKILDNDSLFNYIFDGIVDKALLQYAKNYGAYDVLRFGSHYAMFNNLFYDSLSDKLVITITGKYAKPN